MNNKGCVCFEHDVELRIANSFSRNQDISNSRDPQNVFNLKNWMKRIHYPEENYIYSDGQML